MPQYRKKAHEIVVLKLFPSKHATMSDVATHIFVQRDMINKGVNGRMKRKAKPVLPHSYGGANCYIPHYSVAAPNSKLRDGRHS